MSRDKAIKPDRFAISLEEILDDVMEAGCECAVDAVKGGIRTGAKLWRKHAKAEIGEHTYRRSGETIMSGKYARSIRSHMIDNDPTHPLGEVGSRKLAGLSHLLEDGHARVGGGRDVPPVLDLYGEVMPGTFDAAVAAAEKSLRKGFR